MSIFFKDFSIHKIKSVNLNINSKSFFILYGANGSGKTDLCRAIYGLHTNNTGSVYVYNKESSVNTDDVRSITGFISKDLNLFNNLSALENIKIPLEINGNLKENTLKKSKKLLNWTGLININTKVKHLSDEERLKVALSRALVLNPKVLIVDSPIESNEFLNLLKDLNKNLGITIFLTTDKDFYISDRSQRNISFFSIYNRSINQGIYK